MSVAAALTHCAILSAQIPLWILVKVGTAA